MAEAALRIGLLWHSPNSDNLGVGALTVGHLAILDRVAGRLGVAPRYRIVGAWDPRPPYVVRPDLETRAVRAKDVATGGLYAALADCGLVLDIGAGDSFADIYGWKRALWMLGSKAMALAARRPLALAPQTIGPFDRPLARRLAVMVMNRARLVATRDRLSTACLDGLGVRAPRLEATDVALRLPYDAPPPRPSGGPLRVGLNVSGLLFSGGYTRDNQFGLREPDHPALIRALLRRLAAEPGIEIHLVGHVISERHAVEDDQRVCAALAAEHPGAVLAPAFGHPSEAKSYIAGLDLFLGARMHACIAAFSSGVPVLPMAYSRKFAGLFGTLGYDALIDLRADDAPAALAKLEAALAGRMALAAQARAGLEAGLARLDAYEAVLGDLMREALR
jgi:polysaccharide pyruvyl transferase WcaK-like protein